MLSHFKVTLKVKVLNDNVLAASFTENSLLLERYMLYPESLPNVHNIFKADGREWEGSER